jgi:hypothetical protein
MCSKNQTQEINSSDAKTMRLAAAIDQLVRFHTNPVPPLNLRLPLRLPGLSVVGDLGGVPLPTCSLNLGYTTLLLMREGLPRSLPTLHPM